MKITYKYRAVKKIISFSIFLIFFGVIYSCNQEVSVTPPDSPPPHGYVLIDSNPEGAQIYLDGKNRRRITPDSLTWLETNTYTITLKKELYRDTSITIDAVDGEKKTYFVDYTKNPAMRGQINCNAKPDGSQIILNDSVISQVTPYVIKNLLPGYYRVRFHSANHRDDSVTVVVSSSNETVAKTTLVDTTMWTDFNTGTSAIPTNNLTDIEIDASNNLWIGSDDGGLLKYNGSTWESFSTGNSIIQENHVNTVNIGDDGIIWTGTKSGVFIMDGAKISRWNDIKYGTPLPEGNILDIAHGAPGYEIFTLENYIMWTWMEEMGGASSLISPNDISGTNYLVRKFVSFNKSDFGISSPLTASASDKAGTYFYGSQNDGMFADGSTKQLYNTSNSSILGNYVSALTPDPVNGGIWVGFHTSVASGTGLDYYSNGSFQPYYVMPNGGNTNSILADNTGMKYIGTTIGLITFTNSSDVKTFNKESTGLNMNDVRGVVKDNLGRIWIATYGGGLILKKK